MPRSLHEMVVGQWKAVTAGIWLALHRLEMTLVEAREIGCIRYAHMITRTWASVALKVSIPLGARDRFTRLPLMSGRQHSRQLN